MQSNYDAVVIGEGVAGLAAAAALAAQGLKVATFEAQLFGGLVINVNELDPAPAGRPTSGAELASEMMQANAERGVASIQEEVTGLNDMGEAREVVTASARYRARHVVVASGARLRKLEVPGEAEFEGRGVSQCADCDGPMYQNEDVLVVGGGDSALQEALVLAQYCRRVHLVHRGERFRAASHFVERVNAHDKIKLVWNTTVEAILGSQMVERVRVKHADGRSGELTCAGVFAYIGLAPNTAFVPASLERGSGGRLRTDDDGRTSMSGVWALGAARSGHGGTLDDALREAQQLATALGREFA
jgi:thioredoxin reductase (NADPH)